MQRKIGRISRKSLKRNYWPRRFRKPVTFTYAERYNSSVLATVCAWADWAERGEPASVGEFPHPQ